MKPTSISAEALFEAHREALRWEWIGGHARPERRFVHLLNGEQRSAEYKAIIEAASAFAWFRCAT